MATFSLPKLLTSPGTRPRRAAKYTIEVPPPMGMTPSQNARFFKSIHLARVLPFGYKVWGFGKVKWYPKYKLAEEDFNLRVRVLRTLFDKESPEYHI